MEGYIGYKSLPVGDMRLCRLFDDLYIAVKEHGKDLPIPSVIGVLELLKHTIIKEYSEE